MRKRSLIIVLAMGLGTMLAISSCNDDGDTNCPSGSWDSFEDCMDAKQAAGTDVCECETEGTTGKWYMVYDP